MSSPRMPIRLLEEANIASAYPRELVANFSTGDLTLVGSDGTSQVKIPGNLTKEVSGSGNAVTNVEVSGHKITITKASTFLTAHPTITLSTNASGTTNLAYGGTFNAVESVTQDANGHITKVTTKTVKIPAAQTTITGNAATASKLATARTITLSGAASGSASFDGSADVEIEVDDISAGNVTGLAAVATSGAYADITGTPTLATVATSGKYSDLSGQPSIPTASTVVGSTPSTAAVGTSTAYARADHVHPVQTTVSGNAGTATKLATARTIALKNGAVGSASFDGSKNIEIDVTKIDATKISGVLDIANIPPKALERLCIVATNDAKLALTIDDVQNGDCVKVTGTGLMYFVKDDSLLGTEDAFEAFTAGTAAAVDWAGITNKPSFATVATSGKYSDLSGTPSIPTASTVVGSTPSTAAVGTSTAYARADHVHPLQTSVSGTAGSAAEFTAAKSIALTGDVTGSASSKAGWSITTTLASSGVTSGSYGQSAAATPAHGGSFSVPKITVDAKGRVTAASNISITLPSESNVGVTVSGTGNAVTAVEQDGHGITVTKGATFLTAHPTISKSTNTTSTASPAHGGTFTAIDSVTQDTNGHITKVNTKTVTLPAAPTVDSALSSTSTNAVQNKVINTALAGKAASSHTHNYAGSSSAGGAANSVANSMVVKLNSGTTEGTNMFTFNGSAAKTINITASAIGAATSSHTHTASDVGAAAASHTHSYAGSSSAGGAANSVANSMVVKLNGGTTEGTNLFTFNGSSAKTINITASGIGAAASSHTHTASDVGAAAASHTHSYAGSSSAGGAANSVANSMVVKLNSGTTEGTNMFTFNGSGAKTVNITASGIGAAASSHTHSYAASASAGGAANSVANAMTVKLNGGTTEGTNLFTFNGSSAKTINITASAIGAATSSHTHTASEVGAAAASHTHNYAGSSSAGGAATSVANSMVVKLNSGTTEGTNMFTFNGSAAKSINITASGIGAAASSHTHSYAGSSSAGGSANSVANSLVVKLNGGTTEGTNLFTFNGSAAKTVNITASAIGAAASSHTHSYASTATYTATIGTSWTGSAAPYTQSISVSGITASDNPIVDVKPSDTYATGKSQVEAWGSIYRIVTAANSITVYANDKTTTSIPIQLKCVR